MSERKYRLLFCVPTTALSGGVKVIFEIATGLAERGHEVRLFSFAGPPKWYDLRLPLVPDKNFEEVDTSVFDFIVVSNAFMVPMLLPFVAPARPIFFTQDYEPFHHASGGSRYDDFISDDETLIAIYQLPVPVVCEAFAVQRLIRERAGRDVAVVPIGIDKSLFAPRPVHVRGERDRVLMVGNYLMPYKGMTDGFEALRVVNRSRPIELVLATQEDRGRQLLDACDFPVDIHFRPSERQMPEIYASADLYCCTSWYEGFGLPAVEAFACGVPVVSTRTYGVDDYGIDGTNLLLSEANDPEDLAEKILRALEDQALRARLRQAGFETLRGRYEWPASIDAFEAFLDDVDRNGLKAPNVDPGAMRELLIRMEADGNLTPVTVFRRHGEYERKLVSILASLESHGGERERLEELTAVRDELRPFVQNERAQYHRAFRSLFDLCNVIIMSGGSAAVARQMRRRIDPTVDEANPFPPQSRPHA